MNIPLRELKAKKAKFGFELLGLGFDNVQDVAEFKKSLEPYVGRYYVDSAQWGNSTAVKFYTDHADVADHIRTFVGTV